MIADVKQVRARADVRCYGLQKALVDAERNDANLRSIDAEERREIVDGAFVVGNDARARARTRSRTTVA